MELNFCFGSFVCVNFGRTNMNKSQDERRHKKSHYEIIAHRINTSELINTIYVYREIKLHAISHNRTLNGRQE